VGERVLDLYAGVGLFAAFLAEGVGSSGRVLAIEGSRAACRDARANLPSSVQVEHGPVDRILRASYDEPFDLVVLDPPREGARRAVVTQIVDRVLASAYDEPFDLVVLDPPREGARARVVRRIADRAPRAVAYVACDPAALARDLATFASLGYSLRILRAFDLFPMTHHVECVALLEKGR
jgi:tRNA/tmRNA/rRNA uracil-C5-methylase (TrmA/RlmC/RlmD family)